MTLSIGIASTVRPPLPVTVVAFTARLAVLDAQFAHPAQEIMYQFVHSAKAGPRTLFMPRDLVNAVR